MELIHWNIDREQNALAPPKDLVNKIAVLCAQIYEKEMRPNTLAFPRTILQKLVL